MAIALAALQSFQTLLDRTALQRLTAKTAKDAKCREGARYRLEAGTFTASGGALGIVVTRPDGGV